MLDPIKIEEIFLKLKDEIESLKTKQIDELVQQL
jgi:hypothetical protein